MWALILFRTSLSKILAGFGRREMGLYEAGSVGILVGFRMGMIFVYFQVLGIILCRMEKLKMSIRFRCRVNLDV